VNAGGRGDKKGADENEKQMVREKRKSDGDDEKQFEE